MKISFPPSKVMIKAVLLAIVFSIIGFLLSPYLGFDKAPVHHLFSYGIFFGVLVGGIFVHVTVTSSKSAQMESIFVGNLAFKMRPQALREQFEKYGNVHALRLMTDRETHKPRGFGFVEMAHKDAMAAIRGLNGIEFYGRELKVNIAKERQAKTEETNTENESI